MPQGAGKPALDRCNEGTRLHQIASGIQIKKIESSHILITYELFSGRKQYLFTKTSIVPGNTVIYN
jgi:hypothetical protein